MKKLITLATIALLVMAITLIVVPKARAASVDLTANFSYAPSNFVNRVDGAVFGIDPSYGSGSITLRIDTDNVIHFPAGYTYVHGNGQSYTLHHDFYGYSDVALVTPFVFGNATWATSDILTGLIGPSDSVAALWSDSDLTTSIPSRVSFRAMGSWLGGTADLFIGPRSTYDIMSSFFLHEYFGGDQIRTTNYSYHVTGLDPLSQAENLAEEIDKLILGGEIQGIGLRNKTKDKREKQYISILDGAVDYIVSDDYELACWNLSSLYSKSDGSDKPQDLIEGDAVVDVRESIHSLMKSLDCYGGQYWEDYTYSNIAPVLYIDGDVDKAGFEWFVGATSTAITEISLKVAEHWVRKAVTKSLGYMFTALDETANVGGSYSMVNGIEFLQDQGFKYSERKFLGNNGYQNVSHFYYGSSVFPVLFTKPATDSSIQCQWYEPPVTRLYVYLVNEYGSDELKTTYNILTSEEAGSHCNSYLAIPHQSLTLTPGIYRIKWGNESAYLEVD